MKAQITRLPQESAAFGHTDTYIVTLVVSATEADRITNDMSSMAEIKKMDVSSPYLDLLHVMDTVAHNDQSAIAAFNSAQSHK